MAKQMTTRYSIKAWLSTLPEPVFFEVDKEGMERFRLAYQGDRDAFFVCHTDRGTVVAINLRQVEAANLLWDAGVFEEHETEDDGDWVVLHMRDRSPIDSTVGEPADIAHILMLLELGGRGSGEIMSFVDGDGELMMFDAAALLYLEVPAAVVEEGEKELEEEASKAAQAKPAPRRRRKPS